MMSEKCRDFCGSLQAPDVLPGQEGHSKTRYPLLLLGTRWCRYPKGAGSLHLCALHARRRSAHRHKIPRVPTRSGDRQYERSEWTAHYCFAAGWARYLGGGRPGTSVASSSNQGCAELDKEATRRLDGEACNRLAGGGSGPLRILDRGADRKSVASQFYDWPAEVPLISVEVSLRAPACQMHHDFAALTSLSLRWP